MSNETGATDDGYYGQTRPEMLPFVPATAQRVLELGCAEGAFAAAVKNCTGGEVWGIEYNPQAAERASAVIDRVLVGDADEQIATLPDATSTRSSATTCWSTSSTRPRRSSSSGASSTPTGWWWWWWWWWWSPRSRTSATYRH